jgi:hypothetical protein
MRVTFPRLPDHEPAYAVVERDDGVVYRLYSGRAGRELPHDIRHLIVERTLGIANGIWDGIASGSRRPPRSPERIRWLRAETLGNLVERVAVLDDPLPVQVRVLAARVLSVLPPDEADVDPEAIITAARALRVEAARWARLRVGESLVYEWPAACHGRRAG